MKKSLAILLAATGLVACTSQKKADEPQTENKTLVLYYSQTGSTKAVAEELQLQLGADIEAIEPEVAYTEDFAGTIARGQREMAEGVTPVKPLQSDLSKYDRIFLGYPVWFGTYAMPIAALIQNEDFEGKTIVTFCTFGSGGLQTSTAALQQALPKAEVVEGYGVRTVRVEEAPAELNRFLIERGYKEGEIEALPAFMEHHPVDEAEADLFNRACSGYQYPLGTPVSVAVRESAECTDYEYTATSAGPDGAEVASTVYVTLKKVEGAEPIFTQVIR